MRFPVSWPPIVTIGEEARHIPEVNALTAVRRVAERSHPSVFRRGYARERSAEHSSRLYHAVETRSDQEKLPDRRLMCRRIYHIPVMLDTRSGLDRRQHSRRDEEVPAHIVIEA